MRHPGIPYIAEWTFTRGDLFVWEPWGCQMKLIHIEQGRGWFCQSVNGLVLSGPDGAEVYDWPLDQNYLQMLHVRKRNEVIR